MGRRSGRHPCGGTVGTRTGVRRYASVARRDTGHAVRPRRSVRPAACRSRWFRRHRWFRWPRHLRRSDLAGSGRAGGRVGSVGVDGHVRRAGGAVLAVRPVTGAPARQSHHAVGRCRPGGYGLCPGWNGPVLPRSVPGRNSKPGRTRRRQRQPDGRGTSTGTRGDRSGDPDAVGRCPHPHRVAGVNGRRARHGGHDRSGPRHHAGRCEHRDCHGTRRGRNGGGVRSGSRHRTGAEPRLGTDPICGTEPSRGIDPTRGHRHVDDLRLPPFGPRSCRCHRVRHLGGRAARPPHRVRARDPVVGGRTAFGIGAPVEGACRGELRPASVRRRSTDGRPLDPTWLGARSTPLCHRRNHRGW